MFCGDALDTQQLFRLQAHLMQYIFSKTVFLTAEYPSQQCSEAALIVNMGIPFCKETHCSVFLQLCNGRAAKMDAKTYFYAQQISQE